MWEEATGCPVHTSHCMPDKGPVLSVLHPERWESQPLFPEDAGTAVLLGVVTGMPLETVPSPGLMAT